MRRKLQRAVGFAGSVVAVVRERQVTFLAAGIAYYAFVSLVPLLLLALVVGSVVGSEGLAERIVDATAGEILTPTGEELVRDALTGQTGRGGATVVGVATLLWSGLKVFRGLDYAFSSVYGTAGSTSLLDDLRDGVVVLFAVGVGAVAVAVINAAVGSVFGQLAGTVASLTSLLTLTAVFFPLYYVFPNVPSDLRAAMPGTVFAAFGWTTLGAGFRLYAANADAYAAYGVLGGVLLLVTWLYFGAVVLMLGAVVNAIRAGYAGPRDRQVQHPGRGQLRATRSMTDEDEPAAVAGAGTADEELTADDFEAEESSHEDLEAEIERLREEIESFEDEVEERTVHRDDIESDLKRYVRKRVRRGHARGWGPYLVLLYGTAMTIGAFYLLQGVWAILAMLVVWLSTLGLYTLMVLVGAGLSLLEAPGRVRDAIGSWRS
ncbi:MULTISPECIES: YihY/virulence factor BrkB family protein [Halostella]|uniref:YihY/virulence factor BrkB family protein n=1 Tax=Halostella TaxID=1843185 RepID=UPI001F1FCEB5|nr:MULTISPECIES: YihY/virulence factor BrkB family protein [Halostella]